MGISDLHHSRTLHNRSLDLNVCESVWSYTYIPAKIKAIRLIYVAVIEAVSHTSFVHNGFYFLV